MSHETISPEVKTLPASVLGLEGMTVNGRIQPHGLPTRYWFEYGPDAKYGRQTEPQALPPKREAYYAENWSAGLAGWAGGMSGIDLEARQDEGRDPGFVRFTEPSGDDLNHVDGVGTLHLSAYFQTGLLEIPPEVSAFLGGGEADLRDAVVSVSVRGRDFVPNGSELLWWTQSDIDVARQKSPTWQRANWAYTGFVLTDALASGKWERVSYQLQNNSHAWSYGGNNLAQERPDRYAYNSIDTALGRLNCNAFHLLAFVDPANPPRGQIDFSDFVLRYRNHSLLYPANGARLTQWPEDGIDSPSALTNGWRHGAGKMWRSRRDPREPQEFVYRFERQVVISCLQFHQHAEWPSREIEVLTSADGATWHPMFRGVMPENSPLGANFAFLRAANLGQSAQFVRIRILSGYRPEHWGLGELELFGTGAVCGTDDDWYHVNGDITGLTSGRPCHFRLVVENSQGRIHGDDLLYLAPAARAPKVDTGEAKRIGRDAATLTGRLGPLGERTQFYFEYGSDDRYGQRTPRSYGGRQETSRHVQAPLAGLSAGSVYHYRLVAENASGTSHGVNRVFRTPGAE